MTILPQVGKVPPITLQTRMRIAREWRGLEQIDVARELGVSRPTISNYERGVTTPSKLVINAWAVVCDVDVNWLRNEDAPAGGPDGGGSVHPLGLEPRTHWLIDENGVRVRVTLPWRPPAPVVPLRPARPIPIRRELAPAA